VDNVASQKLKAGGPAGEYTVAWRVVSADSHPIEGTFAFTAASAGQAAVQATSPAAAGSPTAAGTAPAPGAGTGTAPAMGTAQPGTTGEPEQVGSGEPFQWSIVIFAVVAVGLLATLAILARRRLAPGSDDER
jgi:hypothetical protein